MKKLSKDYFTFRTENDAHFIMDQIGQKTYKKYDLMRDRTNRDFIGRIGENYFLIIDAKSRIGNFCVAEGRTESTNGTLVEITTKIHSMFRIIFIIFISLSVLLVVTATITSTDDFSLLPLLGILLLNVYMRLLLHLGYVLARNTVIRKLKKIILKVI